MRLKVRVIVAKFLEFCRGTKATKTAEYYSHHLGKFVERVGHKSTDRLRPTDLTAWAKTWHETQCVKRCFHWAATEANLIRKSPFARVKLPPMRGRERILTPRELTRFMRALRPAPRLFFLAMRETLARPQEIRAARICDLRSENPREALTKALPAGRALIVLQRYKSRERRGDPARPRVLLISARLGRSIMRRLRPGDDDTSPLFLNSIGEPWSKNAVRCVVRRVRRRLKLEDPVTGEKLCSYHVRHSVATEAAAGGVLDRTLADLLGHVETKTTARYQHLCVGHLREALRRANANLRSGTADAKPLNRAKSKSGSKQRKPV